MDPRRIFGDPRPHFEPLLRTKPLRLSNGSSPSGRPAEDPSPSRKLQGYPN